MRSPWLIKSMLRLKDDTLLSLTSLNTESTQILYPTSSFLVCLSIDKLYLLFYNLYNE